MLRLHYHQAILDWLNVTPEIDAAAVKALDELAQRIAEPLPAALREWYSLKDARQHLRGNDDYVLPLEKLGYEDGVPDDMILIIRENQDVAWWALKLDGSDNPPVYVSNDDYDEWALCASTFSDFVFGRVWDSQWISARHELVMWDDMGFGEALQSHLQTEYVELPRGYNGVIRFMPETTFHRFQKDDLRILIVLKPSIAGCEVICNETPELLRLLHLLRPDVQPREKKRLRRMTYYVGELTPERARSENRPF